VFIFDLYVTVNDIKTFSVAQQNLYGGFISPATKNIIIELHVKIPVFPVLFYPNMNLLDKLSQKSPLSLFHRNPCTGDSAGNMRRDPQKNRWLGRKVDGRTDGRTNMMKPIGDSSDYVNANRSVTILLGRDLADNAEVNVDPLSLCDCKG